MVQSPVPNWHELAGDVLTEAIEGRDPWPRLVDLLDIHGAVGLTGAMVSWAETAAEKIGEGCRNWTHLKIANPNTGEVATVDQLPPRLRWATSFFAAHITHDTDSAHALLTHIETVVQLKQNILALLNLCATIIRMHATAR